MSDSAAGHASPESTGRRLMLAPTLMVQGTSSSVGKSLLVAALCRVFANRGVRVAPFKALNISNNAAVCADGAEIGRAQALQALAAGARPTPDMNPVLLKPEADGRCQTVLMGRPRSLPTGEPESHRRQVLWSAVTAALHRLRSQHDLVIVEGSGSPAELNLRAGDIANMAVALHAESPVILVGDIDRGGVFAQLLGTLWLLEPRERELVRGFVVNKFRGDPELFADGTHILEERSGIPVLGVIPYLDNLGLPEEDAVALDEPYSRPASSGPSVDIAVVRLPHIANFDDFDPLAAEPGVRVRYVSNTTQMGNPAAVILPGTKSTMSDLAWLRTSGLAGAIVSFAQAGRPVVGICGGYQILGQLLLDPDEVESTLHSAEGLGLLPVQTVFGADKATRRVAARVLDGPGWLAELRGASIEGYEIHMGCTKSSQPWLSIDRGDSQAPILDGAVSAEGSIWGCYLHGLFANQPLRRAWLASLGWEGPSAHVASPSVDGSLERLAASVQEALDMRLLQSMIWGS